jgi:mono/diheme cytochrome c family protein
MLAPEDRTTQAMNPAPDEPMRTQAEPVVELTQAAAAAFVASEAPATASAAIVDRPGSDFQPDHETYSRIVVPFFSRHCVRCHGPEAHEADFRVDEHLPNEFLTRSVVDKWSEVLNKLNAGEMPPPGEEQPPRDQVNRVAEWIERERLRGERARSAQDIVLRRMNRHEYNNTIRDLIGMDFELVDGFPEDPPAGGFDNNGSALTISPFHMELYLQTAQQILDRAIVDVAQGPGTIQWHFELEDGMPDSDRRRVRLDDDLNRSVHIITGSRPAIDGMVLMRWWGEVNSVSYFTVPRQGKYIIRIRAAGAVPPAEEARQAGIELNVRRQEERESKIADTQERRKSRENFETYSLPYLRKHFEEDPRYDFGPPRLRVAGFLGSRRPILAEFDVTAPRSEPKTYEISAQLSPEKSSILLSNVYHIPGHWFLGQFDQHDDFPRPELFIDWVEVEGPIYDAWPPSSHTRILIESPNRDVDEAAYARDVLSHFMPRAFRRPLREGEVEPYFALFRQIRAEKPNFEEAIKVPLSAVLASPHFLYLVEESESRQLDDYELASRLSCFLWSSMPDAELLELAQSGRLSDPTTLRTQVDRMLADEKSTALVKNFSGQWLGLREVGVNPPARDIYSRYDDHLETSMRGESEAFFAHILHNDRSALEFLKSDYVTINERLARLYEIPGVEGDHFRPVGVPAGVPRGGLVTQASILSITSNGTRTSPVWRGAWILENLLDDPPPPPPPNAGDIPAGVPGLDKATVRERLRLHREHAQCARCHNRIDPLGFALENFAASGEWRDAEHRIYMDRSTTAGPAIDAKAQLPDGTEFEGVEGLQRELLKRQDHFLRCLARKMYTYALGRELGFADDPILDDAVATMKMHDYTLRSLIHHIVTSDAFRTK